jgi:hypothetical protein
MLVPIFVTVAVSYLLVTSVACVLAHLLISDRSVRKLFAIVGVLVPPLAIWAILRTILKGHTSPKYSDQLALVEDEIEAERVAIFGGELLKPSFSEKWRSSYMYSLARAATKVEKLVGPHHLSPSTFPRAK